MKMIRSEEDIISDWKGDIEQPVVSICCIAYNHELYIEDTLKGFLIQETDFPFEILIHDDASTDRTADIIRAYQIKYPKLIKSIYQTENQYSKGLKINSTFNFPRVKGGYIALCEGDDYWISPEKLHMQNEFMKQNSGCSMCFHRGQLEHHLNLGVRGVVSTCFGSTGVLENKGLFFEGGSSVPTASMLFKSNIIHNLPVFFENAPVGDMPLKLLCSLYGNIGYIDSIMCVRRLGVQGSWNERTRLNIKKQNDYLEAMIVMLKEFNKYTEGRWNIDLDEKCAIYATQINRIGISPKIKIKKEYPDFYNSLNFRQNFILSLKSLKILGFLERVLSSTRSRLPVLKNKKR